MGNNTTNIWVVELSDISGFVFFKACYTSEEEANRCAAALESRVSEYTTLELLPEIYRMVVFTSFEQDQVK